MSKQDYRKEAALCLLQVDDFQSALKLLNAISYLHPSAIVNARALITGNTKSEATPQVLVEEPRPVISGDRNYRFVSVIQRYQKISTIKLCRMLYGIGLKEAKELVEMIAESEGIQFGTRTFPGIINPDVSTAMRDIWQHGYEDAHVRYNDQVVQEALRVFRSIPLYIG